MLRFLCSIKTFLNYVIDVYTYLRVVGAFLVVGHTLHFTTEHGRTLAQVPDLFGCVLVKKKSNRKRGVSVNESSRCPPVLSEAVLVYASLLFLLPSDPGLVLQEDSATTQGKPSEPLPVCPSPPGAKWSPQLCEAVPSLSQGQGMLATELTASLLGTENTSPQAHPMLMSRDACWHLPNSTSPEMEPFCPPRLSVSPFLGNKEHREIFKDKKSMKII